MPIETWRDTLIRIGYHPECGDDECRDCAYRDSEGFDYDGYDSEGYGRDGYDQNDEDRNGNSRCANDECYCDYGEGCNARQTDERLMSYSYTPMLRFNGENPPWYGLEIEVTTDDIGSMLDVVENHAPTLVYAKEDSSVDGAELVTHPMSYPWAIQKFPWEMLTDIRETGASVIKSDNGIHIHVSRDGFSNPAHLYRWMKFWYRNPNDIQRLARRQSSHWAPFNPDHRQAQKHHAKFGKPDYNYYDDATLRDRYAAINTCNQDTLEVRVFASTLRPRRAQAALQLVAGTVEYTRTLTAEAITKRHGWDWQAFISYAGKAGDYSALLAENRTRRYL